MNPFKMAVGALIMVGGLAVVSGGLPSPGEGRELPLGPVVKCHGACRTGEAAREADTLIAIIEHQCATEQARDGTPCRLFMRAYDGKGATPFLE